MTLLDERLEELKAEGFEEAIKALSADIAGHLYTAEQSNAALAGATVDTLLIVGSIIGGIIQSLGLPGSPEDLAQRLAATFQLALVGQLWTFSFEGAVEGEVVDAEEEE